MNRLRVPLVALSLTTAAGTLVACGEDAASDDERHLEQIQQDALAKVDVNGVVEVGRRSDAGESFLGETGVEVEVLFDVTGQPPEVAAAFVTEATDGGWSVRVRCPGDGYLITGVKAFGDFDATLSITIDHDSGSLTLRSAQVAPISTHPPTTGLCQPD